MADELEGTTDEQAAVETPAEPVKNPEAVLAKNKELLAKIASEKKEREALAARLAEFEKKEAKDAEEKLAKSGDFDKWRERVKDEHAKELGDWQDRYNRRFQSDAEKDLRLALLNADAYDDQPTLDALTTTVLAKHIKPTDEDGVTVWRTIDDEVIDLADYIPQLKTTYGRHFKADNNPGGDAPGNTGRTASGGIKRSTMTRSEKSAYVTKYGSDAYSKLPL